MNPLRYLEKRIRGWLPQEPPITNPRNKWIELRKKWTELRKRKPTESERKAFSSAIIADGIMTGSFSGTHFLIDRYNENIGLAIIFWMGFAFALVSVNYVIFWYYRKQAKRKGVP